MLHNRMLEIFIQTFFLYFIVIDPLGNTPLFLAVTQNMSSQQRVKTALSAIKKFNKPSILGLHFKKDCLLPLDENINQVSLAIKQFNCEGVVTSCFSPEIYEGVLPSFKKGNLRDIVFRPTPGIPSMLSDLSPAMARAIAKFVGWILNLSTMLFLFKISF